MTDDDTTNETDGAEQRTIELANGTTLRVAQVPGESEAVVTGASVSGSQKENLGDYENYEPHASVRAEFRPAIHMGDAGSTAALTDRLGELRKAVDQNLQESIDNVISGRQWD